MPRRSLGVLAALLAAVPAAVPVPAVAAADSPSPALVIEGKGFGHGVGMAQDGALVMATSGSSAAAILSHFYPGTALGRRSATVRVGVFDAAGPVVVVLPGGGEVRDAPSGPQSPGFPVTVGPGGSVSLSIEGGKFKAAPVSGATITRGSPPPPPAPAPVAAAAPPAAAAPAPQPAAPPTTPTTNFLDPLLQALVPTTVPPTTAPPATVAGAPAAAPVPATQNFALSTRGLWALPKGDGTVALPQPGRTYRGAVVASGGGSGLQLTNELDVEQYLRGMGEMPAGWPAAALQAQAIAARTYAIRAASAGRTLCDDQQCQVYLGAGNESATNNAAVAATRGQVLTYQGSLAETVYSASAGGISATAEEGFGPASPDLPYLQPTKYPLGDPQVWATSIPLTEVAARFGYRGELREARVSRQGPSGRPLEITFDGTGGPMAMDAHRFWSVLQLRSTLFTLRTEAAPEAAGDSLGARLPDIPSLTEPGPDPAVVRPLAVDPLGRAPWVGLAVLLLATWATAAQRVDARRRPASTGLAEVGEGPGSTGDQPEAGSPTD